MTYRAKPITQLDGDPLQWSNCLMAAAACGLDHETAGAKTSTAKKMRGYSGDTSGGTNTDEIERAWHTGYDEDPLSHDGQPWSKVLSDLSEGRQVMLQVWGATLGGKCMSGTGAYGHGINVTPESRTHEGRKQWLVSDPLCKPPEWRWFDESKLKAGAEKWASKIAYEAGGVRDLRDVDPAILRAVVRLLMHRYSPDHPAPEDPPEVGGPVGCLFASTHPQIERGADVAINANGANLTVTRRVRITEDAGFYADAALTDKIGDLAEGSERDLIGPALDSEANALLIYTALPYDDDEKRPTIVYVIRDKCSDPIPDPEPVPGDDVAEAVAARDAEWRAWLDAAPGDVMSTAAAVVAWGELAPDGGES